MSDFLKDKPVTQNVIANILAAPVLYYGAAAVVAIAGGISAYLNDVPFFRAINLSVFLFIAMAIALWILSYAVKNFRTHKAEINESANNAVGGRGYNHDDYLWHGVAGDEKSDLSFYVKVTECTLKENYHANTPYVDFRLVILNTSVFPITIEPKIDGAISFADRHLEGALTISTKWRIDNLRRGWSSRLEIRQWLTPSDLDHIQNGLNARSSMFSFEHAVIIITARNEKGETISTPLSLGFSGVRRDGSLG